MDRNSQSLNGKICLITGANSGIGKAIVLEFARLGATTIMVCRDQERGESSLQEIAKLSGSNSVFLLLSDLSSQASIRQLSESIKARFHRLHILINNAAVIPTKRTLTVDGLETQLAVNYLAPFLLTNLLINLLIKSSPARIINVTSNAHKRATMNLNELNSRHTYNPRKVYAQTKLANVLFTYELARKLNGTNVTSNCWNPGMVATSLLNEYLGLPRLFRSITKKFVASPESAAQNLLYIATSHEVKEKNGVYFDKKSEASSSKASYNEKFAEALWQASLVLTKLKDKQ